MTILDANERRSTVTPIRGRRACAGCGGTFEPKSTWHRRCRTCFEWLRIGLSVSRSQRAFAALRAAEQ